MSDDLKHRLSQLRRYVQSCGAAVGDNVVGHLDTIDDVIAQLAAVAPGVAPCPLTDEQHDQAMDDRDYAERNGLD